MAIEQVAHIRRSLNERQCQAIDATTVPDLPPSPLRLGTLLLDAVTDQPVLAYLKAPDMPTLRQVLRQTPMTTTYRSKSGMSNVSRTFGMAPRKPLQWREGCAPTSLARDEPVISAYLADYASRLGAMLGSFNPVQEQADAATIQQVLPEWRLSDEALWTSGVINKTSALPYHWDRFNFNAWSAMVWAVRGVSGGHLHIPEYDLVVPCQDGAALFWNGNQILHGVTPITLRQKDGYRYSVVYYALRGMKDCFSYAKELEHAQHKRTQRETKAPLEPDADGNPYGI